MFRRRNRVVLVTGITVAVIAAMAAPAGARASAGGQASTQVPVDVTGNITWTQDHTIYGYTGDDKTTGTFHIDLANVANQLGDIGIIDNSTYSVTENSDLTYTDQSGCTQNTMVSGSGSGPLILNDAGADVFSFHISPVAAQILITQSFPATGTDTSGGPPGCLQLTVGPSNFSDSAFPTCFNAAGVSTSGNFVGTYPDGTVNVGCSGTFSRGTFLGADTYTYSITGTLTVTSACEDIVKGAVTVSIPSILKNSVIIAKFQPAVGLAKAAQICNVQDFNWQQTVTSLPAPSPFRTFGGAPLTAPFNDPPPGGYNYLPSNAYPFYWDAADLASNTDDDTSVSFLDAPADPCLPGGTGAGCGGKTAPPGSHLSFTTRLVGVDQAGQPVDLGTGSFSWIDTFNGTSGGIARLNTVPPDPGSGTGGITVTSLDGAVLTNTAATQTITFTSTPPAPAVFGGSYTPAATGGASGNPVLFSIDPSSGAGVCSLSSGTVSFTGAGVCLIDANQAGNATYLPALTAQQKLTIGYTKTITGSYNGPLTLTAGQSVLLAPGDRVTGPVTVHAGAALDVEGATITGPLRADGATAIRACHATITGPATLAGGSGLVVAGDDDGSAPCPGNTITGPVTITANTAGVEFDGNTVTGPLTITGNTGTLQPPDSGPVDTTSNAVSGPVNIQH